MWTQSTFHSQQWMKWSHYSGRNHKWDPWQIRVLSIKCLKNPRRCGSASPGAMNLRSYGLNNSDGPCQPWYHPGGSDRGWPRWRSSEHRRLRRSSGSPGQAFHTVQTFALNEIILHLPFIKQFLDVFPTFMWPADALLWTVDNGPAMRGFHIDIFHELCPLLFFHGLCP